MLSQFFLFPRAEPILRHRALEGTLARTNFIVPFDMMGHIYLPQMSRGEKLIHYYLAAIKFHYFWSTKYYNRNGRKRLLAKSNQQNTARVLIMEKKKKLKLGWITNDASTIFMKWVLRATSCKLQNINIF